MARSRSSSPFQHALDGVEALSPDEQWTVIELIQHRLNEYRRAEMARNAASTLEAVREGRASYGNVDDLRRDLARD